MGNDQANGGPSSDDTRKPSVPRSPLSYRYEDDPPTNPNKGLPTWAWWILLTLLVIIGLPILLIGGLFLFCLLSNTSFHV